MRAPAAARVPERAASPAGGTAQAQQTRGNAFVRRVLQRAPRGIQRRLLLTGSNGDVTSLFALLEPGSGLRLARNADDEVTADVLDGEPPSPALRAALLAMINDGARNSEARLGRNFSEVRVGAFPARDDMTGNTRQRIMISQLEAADAQVPGFGAVMAIHELWENYVAQSFVPQAGVGRYPASHAAATAVERNVGRQLIGGRGRLAQSMVTTEGEMEHALYDYGSFYVDLTTREHDDNTVREVRDARVRRRTTPTFVRVDGFGAGSAAVPGAFDARLAALRDWLGDAANSAATVIVTAFAGAGEDNGAALARQRADAVTARLRGGGDDDDEDGPTDRIRIQVSNATRAQPMVVVVVAVPVI